MRNLFKYDDFPQYVEFQTHSYCNAKCLYCPYRTVSQKLPNGYMSDNIFEKIIDECSRHKLKRLLPYLNNEPFFDKKYIDKLKWIRKKCPDVFIEISTNLSLLTPEKMADLVELQVNELRMSIFGFTRETYNELMNGLDYDTVYSNAEKLIEMVKQRKSKMKLKVILLKLSKFGKEESLRAEKYWKERGVDIFRFTVEERAGNIQDEYGQFKEQKYYQDLYRCRYNRPKERLFIIYNGDVLLCSNDWQRKYILGNINEQSIYDIWNGEKYRTMREYIYQNRPCDEDFLCKKCSISVGKRWLI